MNIMSLKLNQIYDKNIIRVFTAYILCSSLQVVNQVISLKLELNLIY